MNEFRGTTVLGIHHKGKAAIASDGQVTLGNTVMKATAVKVRKLYKDQILAGFAGATADAFSLFDKFETKVESNKGDLTKASVDLATEWRRDKFLGKLDALLIVMDKTNGYIISGVGDVIRADDSIYAIGSGGPFALSAARALKENSKLSASNIVRKSLEIAGSICIYTNNNINLLEL